MAQTDTNKGFMSLVAMLLIATASLYAQSAPVSGVVAPPWLSQQLNAGKSAWTPEQIATMERLRDAAMKDPYTLRELRHLTDNIGPRLNGSPQAQHAVEYVAAEMRALGAEVTLEKTKVPHWVRGEESGELVSWPGQAPGTRQKIMLTALGLSVATPADGVTAEVVVVDSLRQLQALPVGAVKGKILLFNHPFDKELAATGNAMSAYVGGVIYRALGPSTGASLGAVAVLVRSVGGADYRLPHTGLTDYAPGIEKIPAAAVSAEDAELLASLVGQGPVKLHLTLATQTLPDADSYNVIADWKGTEHPEDVVVVSGHLDSWDLGTGAIDDGAGIAVAMQTIHLLHDLGLHPKRTVRFVAWMSEETGSQGADSYIADYAGAVKHHIAAIESDGGADHPSGIYWVGKPELGRWLQPLRQVLEPISAGVLKSSEEAGEDINRLTDKGVPSFAPIQDSRFYFNYHHTAADTFDKVDPKHLNENAAIMTVLSYALADSAEVAPR